MNPLRIDNDLLIAEIKMRPALYDKNDSNYSDLNVKKQLWIEVSQSMFGNWHELSTSEKVEGIKHVQSKWRRMTNYFTRKLRKQDLAETDDEFKFKYVYFDQLLFLLPHIEHFDSINNLPTPSVINDASESKSNGVSDDEVLVIENIHEAPKNSYMENKVQNKTSNEEVTVENFTTRPKKKRKQHKTYEEQLLEILQQKRQEESVIDEDKLFLMSLLPTFKRLNDEQKLVAKTEIMQTLRHVLFSGYTTSGFWQNSHVKQPPKLSTLHPNSSSDVVKNSSTSSNVESHSTFIYKSEVFSPEPLEEEDTNSDVSSILG